MSLALATALPARPLRPAHSGRGKKPAAPIPGDAGLQVHLLGPPQVTWEGRPLDIPRLQTRALLFRLAAAPHGVPRGQLCFLFWPDIPEASASRRLTRLVTHLRRALPAPGVVLARPDSVGLDPGCAGSDVLAFLDFTGASAPAGRLGRLPGAVGRYHGPLRGGGGRPGVPALEAGARGQPAAQGRADLEALRALIEERANAGELVAAIDLAQRYLDTDPLAEGVHRRLIELYALAGDRSAALQQYERCAVALERELGVDPLPETRAVYEALLHGVPAARAPPAAWTTLPSLHAPLVGRDEALRHLEHALARARSGCGQIVLISGEAGIGKSRLLQEFASAWQGRVRVLVGSGREAGQDLPYGLLLEALQPCAADLIRVMPAIERPLSTLLPGLSPSRTALRAAPHLERQQQGPFFRTVAEAMVRLAGQQPPLILCLDDLHWADATTLRWLAYFSRQIPAAPVLAVGTCRSEEASTLATLRAHAMRGGAFQEIHLQGLSQADVLCLIRSLSGQSRGAELLCQRLHRETGGNPYFVLETVRALFEAGTLWQDRTGWNTPIDEATEDYQDLPLPDTLRQAIHERLGRLTAQARQVLEAGAILGYQFDLDAVVPTSGRSEGEVVEALETLLDRQILTAQGRQVHFNHELMRTTVLLDLSYGRRRLLHRRAGQALAALRPGDLPGLVRHFAGAEEPRRAALYALQAAHHARSAFGSFEARLWLDRALALLDTEAARLSDPETVSANRRLRFQVLDERGWAQRIVGDMKAYARDSREAARLAKLLRDPQLLAHVSWREARAHRWFCRYVPCVAAAQNGLHASRQTQDAYIEALCLREIGLAARETGDYEQGRTALEQALALFVSQGEVVYELHVLGNLSTLWCLQGAHQRAMALAQRALARCDELDLPLERRLPLGDIGAAAAMQGDALLARRSLLESLEIARRVSDRTQEILCLGHLGWVCVREQMPDRALEHLRSALGLAERVDSRAEQSWLHLGLARARLLSGQPDQALPHARRAFELARTCGRFPDQAAAERLLAELSASPDTPV